PLAPAAREALAGAEGVRALGRVPHDEMPRYLRAASAGISIPDSDGSPSSVWEALACGLPLVLSPLPQVSERLGADAGARFAPPEANAVAEALAGVLDDRAEL